MFSSETAITSIRWKCDSALSYNGAKRNCGRADEGRRKKMIDEHLKLLTMPRTILFYNNYKK